MKKNEKIVAVLLVSILSSINAYAQIQMPNNNSPVGSMVSPVEVNKGNTYEKEVTPLLRDISKKKSLLELRKLDRELEKIEEEALTSQIERDKLLNPVAVNVTPGFPNQGQPFMGNNPVAQTALPVIPVAPPEEMIRVLMVYGFDNDLYAKISNGTQGGYIVKKGDVMPDGRIVTEITSNFIEVKKSAKDSAKSKTQKLYISGPYVPKQVNTQNIPATVPALPSGPGTMMIPAAPPQMNMGGSSSQPQINMGGLPPQIPIPILKK